MTASALVREMGATGVLGGGRIGAAADVVEEMFRRPDFTNFLTIAGPMVPSGFRLLIGDLIDRGFLDAIVTTGANLTHDVIEALGLHHYQGTFQVDDRLLIKKGYSRIADIFVKEESFQILDKTIRRLLGKIPAEQRRGAAFSDILGEIGLLLRDKDSILYKAARNKVKVFSPG
jgi:deoxyhypusine synthase